MIEAEERTIRVLIAEPPSPNYGAALRLAGMEPVDSREADPQTIAACAALVLPGGGDVDPALYGQENTACRGVDREADKRWLALIRSFAAAGKPILGVCKGMQLLNVCFGGTLVQDIPQEPRHGFDREAKLQRGNGDRAHLVSCTEASLLTELYGMTFPVNSCHHQAADRVPDCFTVLARSDDGVTEAILHKEKPILAVQWHPERMCGANLRSDTVDGLPIFLYLRSLIEGTDTGASR